MANRLSAMFFAPITHQQIAKDQESMTFAQTRGMRNLAGLCLLIFCAASLSAQTDPGVADTVRVDSLVTFGTGVKVLPISVRNDENLSAVEVTLRESSTAIVVDSISFIGTRFESVGFKGWSQDISSGTTTIYAFATVNLITPGVGIMAKAYLRVLDATPGSIPIDTGSFQEGPLVRTTSFTADGATGSFIPRFHKGWVTITSTPITSDSITVDSVFTQRGTQVSVPVFINNVSNLSKVNVALTYASTELLLDSVSFSGGRVNSATNSVSHNAVNHSLLISSTLSDIAPLLPGNGELCRMYFSVPVDATPGIVLIDSTTYFNLFGTELTRASGGGVFVPIFHRGKIVVDQATDVNDGATIPMSFSLSQNYPNPFNPTTQVTYSLPSASAVRLVMYDVLGQEVGVLVDQKQAAGTYQVTIDAYAMGGSGLATGVYFYELTTDTQRAVRKMLFLK